MSNHWKTIEKDRVKIINPNEEQNEPLDYWTTF